ncbi:MAG: DNA polymerase I [Parachlamydiales bacterium]|nr:DNA polymerase I [Verrucomicrobiota bacterium]MBX3718457.1 DNA polymerase I [Candidatus Acheromyda pituitae]
MQSLYIVDAVNFLFRSYYAIGPMSNPKGASTNALYGFIRSIYKIINDFSPDYFIAVFDGPDNKKSRTAIYKEYKGHRAGMPEDLFPQLDQAQYFCEIAGIPSLTLSGVEADDTMGSVAKWAEKKGINVFLCSSDKDLCQLVTDHVKLVHPHKDNLVVDRKKVKELFGVRPDQMIDYLAMVGDASDNIPGLEGFGPKTAASLLEEFGTLEKILANPDRLSGKKREVVINGQEIALLSKQLATIQTDLDIPHEELFYHLKTPDLPRVQAFYHEMHFLSLLRELSAPQAPAPTKTKSSSTADDKTSYQLINDEDSLAELVRSLSSEKEICVDTETTSVKPMWAQLVGIGLGSSHGKAYYIPLNGDIKREKVVQIVKPLLENPDICFIGHNIKYDMHVLANEGIELSSAGFDTLLASYLINPHVQRHNLDELSLEHFGKVKIPIDDLIGKGKKQITMAEVPIEEVCAYCCEDVDYTLRLKTLFQKELEKADLTSLFATIEMPLISVLFRMERAGIYVDVNKLEKMSHELSRELHHLEKQIYAIAGESFNINSPKQLSVILFEKMGIKPPKKTATGYSTAADVLESLQESAPIVKKILEYRTLEKLRSTYVDALPEQIYPKTHRIHCTFNQSIAATGRLSCQDPNLQNIPVRTEAGKKIREAFKPQKPHHTFVSADYSQIELRLLAHLSQDPALIAAFEAGEDIHAYTASLVFDVPLNKVTPQMRYQSKAVNFGIVYGQQAYGLSQELGIEFKEAAAFIETYFERYKKIKEFLNFCKDSVRKTGRAVTLTGRQRPIPDIHSKNPMLRAQAERLAVNTPLQGTAADLIKLAMLAVDALLKKEFGHTAMILQIHDELLFEVPDDQVDKLSKKVKHVMETVMDLSVPLVVDISIGKNWGEC